MKQVPGELIRALALEYAGYGFKRVSPKWAKVLSDAKPDSAEFAQAVAAVHLHCNGMEIYVGGYAAPDQGREEFLAALKLLGVDGSAAWQKPKPQSARKGKEVAEKKSQSGHKGAAKPSRPAAKAAPKKSPAKAPKKKPTKKGGKR